MQNTQNRDELIKYLLLQGLMTENDTLKTDINSIEEFKKRSDAVDKLYHDAIAKKTCSPYWLPNADELKQLNTLSPFEKE